MLNKIKKDLYDYRLSIIAVLIYITVMQLTFDSICPIKIVFGIKCPGCGLTHATIYLLTGKFYEAIKANFTVIMWWSFILIFIFDRYVHKIKINIMPVLLCVVEIVTIVRYIYMIQMGNL